MMTFTILTPVYLPEVNYFKYFLDCDIILFADHFQFKKRSNIVRSSTLLNNTRLTIPVKHTGYKQKISEKKIAPVESWNKIHLKTIRHLYHNFPYFEEYYPELIPVYNKPDVMLSGFLLNFIIWLKNKLKIECTVETTSQLDFSSDLHSGLIQFSVRNKADFYFRQEDVRSGWFSTDTLKKNNVSMIAFREFSDNVLKMNILEFLFRYGIEAAYKIRMIQ